MRASTLLRIAFLGLFGALILHACVDSRRTPTTPSPASVADRRGDRVDVRTKRGRAKGDLGNRRVEVRAAGVSGRAGICPYVRERPHHFRRPWQLALDGLWHDGAARLERRAGSRQSVT